MRSWIAWLGVSSALALLATLVLGLPEQRGPQPAGGSKEAGEPVEDSRGAVARPEVERQPPQEPAPDPAPREARHARSAPSPKPAPSPRKPAKKARQFDEDSLAAAGLNSADVVWLRDHFEAAKLERAKLRAAAKEEGRPMTAEERQAAWEFESELEEEMGSEDYDRMLYASGDHNRVRVRWVSTLSPASEAGLAEGDVILSWDGSPIYRSGELRWLLQETPPGTAVPIGFQRGDEVFQTEMVTGPPPRRFKGVDGIDVSSFRVEP